MADEAEQKYTKQEIFEMYLNQIYFGRGAYGVESAANTYFGKHVEDLSLAECAMLAGIPKSPNYYSPINNPKAGAERRLRLGYSFYRHPRGYRHGTGNGMPW